MQHAPGPISMLFVYMTDKRTGKAEMEQDITELWNLTESLGDVQVADLIVQKGVPFRATYIGPGKVEEIGQYLREHRIDVITFGATLSPNQKFTLTKSYWEINPAIEVWDRVDLILAIFSKHAHTREATLQIELARMRHMGPAIFGMGRILSRQGGGVGTRGIGETNTELMKRHWKREMKRITDELEQLTQSHTRQIRHRQSLGLSTVSLVGYTNAGKTTLFNLLTHKKKSASNAMFVTLDSVVGNIYIPELQTSVAVSDTIGFIRNLPPDLIDAFKSTLLESIHAEVILHVIDLSDRDYALKFEVVENILDQLEVPREKVVCVFNKTDAAKNTDRARAIDRIMPYPHVFISATTGDGIPELLKVIGPRLIRS
jgi:GTPase